MPRYEPNKVSLAVKRRYFELIRYGLSGAEASRRVGVSISNAPHILNTGTASYCDGLCAHPMT